MFSYTGRLLDAGFDHLGHRLWFSAEKKEETPAGGGHFVGQPVGRRFKRGGGGGWTRTTDQGLMSPLLLPLSYAATTRLLGIEDTG